MPITFEDTFTALKEARQKFVLAMSMEPSAHDGQVKVAYFTLYEAARLANTLYVARKRPAMEDGGLISWAKSDFQEITEMLYLKYYRQGNYPKQGLEADFDRWFERVKVYINRLHEGLNMEKSTKRANEWMDKKSVMDMPGRTNGRRNF
jgi:hypothetical protein